MNMKELEAFDAVLSTGTITEAARYINRTQPQATRLINALEERIGFKLFDRSRKRLILTPQGREFHEKVKDVLDSAADLDAYARRIRSRRETNVRILCTPHMAAGLIPQSLKRFMAENPSCTITVDVKSRLDMTTSLTKQNYDLGLAVLPIDEPSTEVDVFKKMSAVAALPADHPLASKSCIHISDLVGQPIIASRPRTFLRVFIEREFQKLNETPEIVVEHANSVLSGLLIEQGIGVAILEPYVAKMLKNCKIVCRPIVPKLFLEYTLLYPQNRPRPEIVTKLAQAIIASS